MVVVVSGPGETGDEILSLCKDKGKRGEREALANPWALSSYS